MPRLFDRRSHRYTYTVLMSASMSLVMSVALGLIRLDFSFKTLVICLLSWPLAFVINMGAATLLSPLMRSLTVWIWRTPEA